MNIVNPNGIGTRLSRYQLINKPLPVTPTLHLSIQHLVVPKRTSIQARREVMIQDDVAVSIDFLFLGKLIRLYYNNNPNNS